MALLVEHRHPPRGSDVLVLGSCGDVYEYVYVYVYGSQKVVISRQSRRGASRGGERKSDELAQRKPMESFGSISA
jgi:hypothetical protein